jgi:Tol biopolymer transport system component
VGEGAEDAIAAWNAAGERTVVRRYQGKAAFAWSPSGARLGYAISHDTRSPGYSEGLCVAEVGGQERLIATGQVMAFFWSPLGQQVAYLTANPARDRLDLLVAQADGSGRRQVASLVPSEDFMFFLSFFDQFAPAASLWSPDGRTLAFAGKALREHGNGKGAGDQNHVYVVAADGSSQPEEAAPGSIGVFAP